MATCDKCGGGVGAPGDASPAPGPTGVPAAFKGALFTLVRTIRIPAGSPTAIQSLFTFPPAAAIDVFVRFRNPDTGSTTDNAVCQFYVFASQPNGTFQVDSVNTGSLGADGRLFAIRDFPCNAFEVKGQNTSGNDGFYDVVVIGWAREPTGQGPFPLMTFQENGTALPTSGSANGRLFGSPLMAGDASNILRRLAANHWDLYFTLPTSGAASLNTIPFSTYLASPPARTDTHRGPLISDAAGNLRVALSGSGGAATFPTASALADDDANPTTTRVGANLLLFDGSTWDRARTGVITAGTPTGWQNVLSGGVFNSSAPSLSNGQAVTLQVTSAGNLKVAEQFAPVAEDNTNGVIATQVLPLANTTYTYSRDVDFGTVTKKNVKGSTGNVYGFTVENTNAAARYFQIHNKATAPAATEAPVYSVRVASNEVRVIGREFFGSAGINLSAGIGWAWSTTKATFTDAATAGDHTTHVHFK